MGNRFRLVAAVQISALNVCGERNLTLAAFPVVCPLSSEPDPSRAFSSMSDDQPAAMPIQLPLPLPANWTYRPVPAVRAPQS
jgi:hypothetical protein